jgi:hypothetical protein
MDVQRLGLQGKCKKSVDNRKKLLTKPFPYGNMSYTLRKGRRYDELQLDIS